MKTNKVALPDKIYGRLCGGLIARFQKMSGRVSALDLKALHISFSQHGEDLLIFDHLQGLSHRPRGIYIDAGCYDPYLLSNTRLLNLHGWRGINVDADRGIVERFAEQRPDDHNVCAALSEKRQEMLLIGKRGWVTRQLSHEANQAQSDNYHIDPVTTETLADILESSPFKNHPVDLLDIDCESHDIEVLRGFPFGMVRPVIVCIEAHTVAEANVANTELAARGYRKIATRGPTLIYRDEDTFAVERPKRNRESEL